VPRTSNGSVLHGVLVMTAVAAIATVVAGGCGYGATGGPGGRDDHAEVSSPGVTPPRSVSPRRRADSAPGGPRSDRGLGRSACRGMSAVEAANRFLMAAKEAGVTRRFADLVSRPSPATEQSPGYPRLVAAFYATTLPELVRREAAAGCAEELAAETESGEALSGR
jgi:hypothetical protein